MTNTVPRYKVCWYCMRPLTDKDIPLEGDMEGSYFCSDTDCMKMYYYEEELERHEEGKFTWW